MRVKNSRKSGLRILDDMPWGRHVSLFYETKEDLFEIVVPYLRERNAPESKRME